MYRYGAEATDEEIHFGFQGADLPLKLMKTGVVNLRIVEISDGGGDGREPIRGENVLLGLFADVPLQVVLLLRMLRTFTQTALTTGTDIIVIPITAFAGSEITA